MVGHDNEIAVANTRKKLDVDLAKSGITVEDLGGYLAREPEVVACKIGLALSHGLTSPGYVIPYYGIDGKRQPFYRVRIFDPLPGGAKYLQPGDTSTYVYYPKEFHSQLQALERGELPNAKINGFEPYVIICEGEKKAVKASKEGFLAVALGGVYNWKSRTITLPGNVKIERDEQRDLVRVKIPTLTDDQGDQYGDGLTNKWAVGFNELITMIQTRGWNVLIVFDSDYPPKPQVQKAAAALAFELRSAGIPLRNIRQLHLPTTDKKVAIDDYLTEYGPKEFVKLVHKVLGARCAFPTLPNMREYVNSKLRGRLTRQELKELASALLADMDVGGVRLYDVHTESPYYFDNRDRRLLPVNLMATNGEPLHETPFGKYLYKRYDISSADTKLLPWLAAGFTGEDPVFDVRPHSVYTITKEGNVAFQINDGQYILVTGDPDQPIKLMSNGTGGLLFKADQVESLAYEDVSHHFARQMKKGLEPWWLETTQEFKFTREDDKKLAALLFYISPWLLRWKGTQLPVELMVGEPGSGKSSMYMLRMTILTGRPALRNQPHDVRDWYSSISQVDGLHVTDNVHFVTKDIRQRLSDEICRLVTEPDPYVELRKLFTTSKVARIPVRTVFALTAIQQPFTAADILQRAAIFELEAVGGDHDNDWVGRHIRDRGGRAAWVAHHLLAIHLFLKKTVHEKGWDTNYRSNHRLVNYEQALSVMGEILQMGTPEQIKKQYMRDTAQQVSEYDWTMEGLKEFALEVVPLMRQNLSASFTCQNIAEWSQGREEFKDNLMLNNSRRLARYIKSHATMVEKVTGIYDTGKKKANRDAFRVHAQPKEGIHV